MYTRGKRDPQLLPAALLVHAPERDPIHSLDGNVVDIRDAIRHVNVGVLFDSAHGRLDRERIADGGTGRELACYHQVERNIEQYHGTERHAEVRGKRNSPPPNVVQMRVHEGSEPKMSTREHPLLHKNHAPCTRVHSSDVRHSKHYLLARVIGNADRVEYLDRNERPENIANVHERDGDPQHKAIHLTGLLTHVTLPNLGFCCNTRHCSQGTRATRTSPCALLLFHCCVFFFCCCCLFSAIPNVFRFRKCYGVLNLFDGCGRFDVM